MRAALWGLVLAVPAWAQEYDPGERIEEAVSLQVTPAGFDQLEDILQVIVPDLLAEQLGAALDPIEFIGYSITNARPILTVQSINLTPNNGVLKIAVRAKLKLSEDRDPLHFEGPLCDEWGWIGPIDTQIDVNLGLAVVNQQTGGRGFDVSVTTRLDATIDGPTLIPPSEGDFHLGTCGNLLGGVVTVFQNVLITSVLQPVVDGLVADLEPTIEDALSAASLSQEIALGEASLSLALEPKRVSLETVGMELVYSITADAPQAACVADVDPEGSPKTSTTIPAIGANPAGTQIAAHLANDALNQILYAAFRGGVLCYTVDQNAGLDLPITLDTSLLGVLGGDGFREIFPTAAPLVIQTRPKAPPTARFTPQKDVRVDVERLGLDFMGELDGRMARALALEVSANVGANLAFDATTGSIGVEVDTANLPIHIAVVPDVLVAGTEESIAAGVEGLATTLVGSLVEPLLQDAVFPIPAFYGFGITSLDAYPAGASNEWLTASLALGVADYGDPAGGCGGTGDTGTSGGCSSGCDASSCSSGCSTSGPQLAGGLALLIGWVLRRRR
ncbi:MAG TPA: hypothetical protein PKA64_18635 [Myxococcota bacterium]|nr:hypothetical protein [Myxococcota bacterium]